MRNILTQDADEMLRLDRAEKEAERRWREAMKGNDIVAIRIAAREYTAAAVATNRYALMGIEPYSDR